MPCGYVYQTGGGRESVAVAAYSIFCGRLLQVCSSSYDGQYQSLDEWDEQRVRLSRFLFIPPTHLLAQRVRKHQSADEPTCHTPSRRTNSIPPPLFEGRGATGLTRNRNWACQTNCLHDNPGLTPPLTRKPQDSILIQPLTCFRRGCAGKSRHGFFLSRLPAAI